MSRFYMDNDWRFSEEFSEEMINTGYDTSAMKCVRIPHTVKELPFHYFDEKMYQMVSGYIHKFDAPSEWQGKTLLLTFEAVAHEATVYLNGELLGVHSTGYTAFTFDISDKVKLGSENVLVVKCDSRESLNTPPFGFVVDYLTYGGIYRDVYIDVKEDAYFADVFVKTKLSQRYEQDGVYRCGQTALDIDIVLAGKADDTTVKASIRRKGDEEYETLTESPAAGSLYIVTGDRELWDIDNPALYELRLELIRGDAVIDTFTTNVGYRRAEFRKNAFYLNGRKVKIRGLNRHQSYAYVGYAMPDSMQKLDAEILKKELGVNTVRTSHYPQAHSFIERCDELGLLVVTEFPGWQHIGDDAWKTQAVENAREMITQYRNHPSIILWGVRINESGDDEGFYARTNALAHELDPTRQTCGVRSFKKGIFQEDVYTYNDFSNDARLTGCLKKSEVTSDVEKPYLITEFNGHMYPTKAYDWEEHRLEHLKRHVAVLDKVAGADDISGCIGWCMFDYNTHKDFGSGDKICYHGVMDMFRNPKLAAAIYAMQQDETPVLQITSTMDIGEHPASNRGDVYILTNLDSVKMYKNDSFIKEYVPSESKAKNLRHGPILIDDIIGSAIKEGEPDMSEKEAEDLKALLNAVAKDGLYGIPKITMAKAAAFSMKYHVSMDDAVKLYNKYVGDWGGAATTYRFEGYKDGELVKEINVAPAMEYHLETIASSEVLKETHTYDVAEVRIRACDEYGNTLPFAVDPLKLETTGDIELIGPDMISLQGGMTGVYVKSVGKSGKGSLRITEQSGAEHVVEFSVEV